jgi:chromosome segregation ATPase
MVAQAVCGDEFDQLQSKAKQLETTLNSQQGELAAEHQRAQELTQQLARQRQETESLTERYESLHREHAALSESLSHAERQRADALAQREHEAIALEELRGKLDAAQCEAQKYVGQIAELEERLAQQEKNCASQSQDASTLVAEKEALATSLRSVELDLKKSHADNAQHAMQVIELREKLETALRNVAELKAGHVQLGEELAQLTSSGNAQLDAMTALRAERDKLAQQLASAEQHVAEPAGADPQEVADLRRRLEMKIDEVRDLKEQNVQLEADLAKAKGAPRQPAAADTGAMDWEAQKRRLLASLDEQFDESSPEEQAERLKIEDAIQQTEEAVAARDRELAEKNRQVEALQRQLADQERRTQEDAATRELLDQDALIRQERERLQMLQQQWEEKLRQAEVDLSLERAKVARERAKLDEELQTLRQDKTAVQRPGETEKNAKSSRGRWLARLGLQDIDNA